MKSRTPLPLLIAAVAILAVPVSNTLAQVDFCESTATSAAGVNFACPAGDGEALGAAGLTITVTIIVDGVPIEGIPAEDFWLIGCNDMLYLCGGANSIDATGPTGANGVTTITGPFATGGCDTGVRVVCQGVVLGNGPCLPICLPIEVRSVDQRSPADPNPDGEVTLADLAFFGTSYGSPPKPYFACHDFVGGPYGTITLADFAKFGQHFGHMCL